MESGGKGLFERRVAMLIAEVQMSPANAAQGFEEGPLPLPLGGQRTNRTARATYFSKRACGALYGSTDEADAGSQDSWRRRYRWAGPANHVLAGLPLTAVELLRTSSEGAPDGLAILHVELPSSDPVEALEQSVSVFPKSEARGDLDRLLNGAASVAESTKRLTSVVFLTPSQAPLPPPPTFPQMPGWNTTDQWLWALASASSYSRFPPHVESHAEAFAGRLRFSADWEGLVLRDGTSFLGLRPDDGQSKDPFFDFAETYVRSIYLDAILLGIIQRMYVTDIADAVAEFDDPLNRPEELMALERKALRFRNVFWWQHVTSHGIANDLLRAYRDQHQIDALGQQVFEELGEFSRQVQTVAAKRTQTFIGLITVLGLPLGAAVGIVQMLGRPGVLPTAIALTAAIVVALLLLKPLGIEWQRIVGASRHSKADSE